MTTAKPQASSSSDLNDLSPGELQTMAEAAEEILECYRVLEKTGTNTVAEVLAGQGTFYEYDHYPRGDVYDAETHAQYYYHAHRPDAGEHGHFHTFIRKKGIPDEMTPVIVEGDEPKPDDDVVCHLVAISMDAYGFPIGLFTTNRWVTDEIWYQGDDVCRLLDRFLIDHTYPNWAVNRWISAMIRLFKPQIRRLIAERDRAVTAWADSHPGENVFEDRDLEVTSSMAISVDDQIAAIRAALDAK